MDNKISEEDAAFYVIASKIGECALNNCKYNEIIEKVNDLEISHYVNDYTIECAIEYALENAKFAKPKCFKNDIFKEIKTIENRMNGSMESNRHFY